VYLDRQGAQIFLQSADCMSDDSTEITKSLPDPEKRDKL